jgi:hypothetical protein
MRLKTAENSTRESTEARNSASQKKPAKDGRQETARTSENSTDDENPPYVYSENSGSHTDRFLSDDTTSEKWIEFRKVSNGSKKI